MAEAKTAPAKAAKPAPEKAAKAAGATATGRPPTYADEMKIRFLAGHGEKNPKRQGSASYIRFSKYREGMTVAEYRKAAGAHAMGDLRWDVEHGFIAVD